MALVLEKALDASPERVFSVLSDLGARQRMDARDHQDRRGIAGSRRTGTSWREARQAGTRTMESTIRITAFEPARTIALMAEAKVLSGDMRFTLEPSGAGTRVHHEAVMRGHGLMRLMTGAINRMMAAADADLLDRLAAQLNRPS